MRYIIPKGITEITEETIPKDIRREITEIIIPEGVIIIYGNRLKIFQF